MLFTVGPYLLALVPAALLAIGMWNLVGQLGVQSFVWLLIAFGIIEIPLWLAIIESTTCEARTGDPSCVSVVEAGAFYQAIALPLTYAIYRVIRR